MNIKEIVFEGVDCFQVAQYRFELGVLVNIDVNLWVLLAMGKFLNS